MQDFNTQDFQTQSQTPTPTPTPTRQELQLESITLRTLPNLTAFMYLHAKSQTHNKNDINVVVIRPTAKGLTVDRVDLVKKEEGQREGEGQELRFTYLGEVLHPKHNTTKEERGWRVLAPLHKVFPNILNTEYSVKTKCIADLKRAFKSRGYQVVAYCRAF